MTRLLTLAAELLLIAAAVFAADWLQARFELIPDWLVHLPAVDYPAEDFWTVLRYFLAVHVVVLPAVQWLRGPWRPGDARRTVDEIFALGAGFAIAALLVFVTTTVSFDPQFVVGIPLFAALGLLVADLGVALRREGVGGVLLARMRAALRRTFSVPGLLTVALAVSPGVLAKLFVSDRDIANVITQIRITLADRSEYAWGFADAAGGERFRQAMVIQFPPGRDDELYLLERGGRLLRVPYARPGAPEVVLDISDQVGFVEVENGALGFDFHPDFGRAGSANGDIVYLYYTSVHDGEQLNRLSRFRLGGASPAERAASEEPLIVWDRRNDGFHNGGSVEFGPDGYLYLAIGEMSDPSSHQRVDAALTGGILRIDVDRRGGGVSHPPPRQPRDGVTEGYYIPGDNPFVGRPETLEEYWALGLRNPFRVSFDPATGDLWAGEVGSTVWEEVNRIEKGRNYQFPFVEGREETGIARPSGVVGEEAGPVYTYEHTAYERAAIGGIVYRGSRYPGLRGRYVFADNYSGKIFALPASATRVDEVEILAQADQFAQRGITSFTEAPDGEILITTLGKASEPTGRLMKLVPGSEAAVAAPDAGTTAAVSAAEAANLFRTSCGRCHGERGAGDGPDADAMDVPVPDLRSAQFQASRDDARLRAVIVDGGAAHGLSPMMPPWGQLLTPAEIDALVRHVRTLGADQTAGE